MDFVVDLPKFQEVDTMTVVINRLSIYSHFLPQSLPFNAKTVVGIICYEVVCLHGMPCLIVFRSTFKFFGVFLASIFSSQSNYI